MFVPTVRIAEESAFSTDWATLNAARRDRPVGLPGARASRRHDPIPVDGRVRSQNSWSTGSGWRTRTAWRRTTSSRRASKETTQTRLKRLTDNLPGHAGRRLRLPLLGDGAASTAAAEPDALGVNEQAFGKLYRYGFVQESTGYNTLRARGAPTAAPEPAGRRARMGCRPAARASSRRALPAVQARLTVSELDAARRRAPEGRIGRAPRDRATSPGRTPRRACSSPRTSGGATAHARGRGGRSDALPAGPAWGAARCVAHASSPAISRGETDPQAGADLQLVADSDHRDAIESVAAGRYPPRSTGRSRRPAWARLGSATTPSRRSPGFEGRSARIGSARAASGPGLAALALARRRGPNARRPGHGSRARSTAIGSAARAASRTSRRSGRFGTRSWRRGCEGSVRRLRPHLEIAGPMSRNGDLTDGNAIGVRLGRRDSSMSLKRVPDRSRRPPRSRRQ